MKTSGRKGYEATIAFEGIGAVISGFYPPTGGTADIFLDGELGRTVDVYPDEPAPKGWESVWRDYCLEAGKHTLRIVVRASPTRTRRAATLEGHRRAATLHLPN